MRIPRPTVRMLAVFLVPVCLGLVSQRTIRGADDVVKTLQDAKDAFQPISPAAVAESKAELNASLKRLEEFLTSEPGAADQWKSRLKWDAMQAELAKENPNLGTLDDSLNAFHEDVDGLEREPFLETRALLRSYMNAVLFSGDAERTKQGYVARIDDLMKQLEAYAKAPSSDTAITIGHHLGWFERARQSPQVVKAIRESYSHPNLFADVSHRIFTAGIDNEVEQSQQVSSYILGTSIHGTANVTGRITSAFVPDAERASFDLLLTGNIFSNNVGYNGPVTIYSTARTSVNASKRVHFDAAGFLTDFAWAQCATGSNINRIAARSCLVRKIAWQRAGQSKTTAERLAAGQAQQRVAGNFDEQTAELLAEPETGYADKFRKPLLRRGGFPKVMKFSTSEDRLTVKMLQENRFQLAAPAAPPAIGDGHDVAVRVHESLVGNYSETLLGGVRVTDEQMVQMYVDANREVPKDLQITDESEPWAITFARNQPISVRFDQGGVHIEVRCRSLHRGEDYPAVNLAGDEIRIAADYKLVMADGGIQLVRPDGDVQIDFLLRGKVVGGLAQAAQKGFLQSKFNAMLKPKLPEERTDGIKLRGRWERAGKLVARESKSAGGWLVLGLAQVPPAETSVASAAATDAPEGQTPTAANNQPPAAAAPAASETAGLE